jgi:ABC-type transport system involved in multi-copper enzyme maturation permease subunit
MQKARISFITIILIICLILSTTPTTSAVRIIGSDPEHGERDVPIDTKVVIKFDETMDKISVENNIEIYTDTESESYQLIWSNNDKDLTIKFVNELNYNQKYTIMLIGAQDTEGNSLENPTIFFETEEEDSVDASIILYSIIFMIIAFIIFLIGYSMGNRKKGETE